MSYLVLARKWRPQAFADLVGQSHVSVTLGNAIAAGRVAHAFLFTGVRGVGKTTSARILAKALNCEKGPTIEPCQTCPQCLDITKGADVDVQEIDGASYTGVNDVRRLQESLPYRPARDRFKIFIVDEVHMLSNAAWNAFLKTLEEPPPHVKFIFATTEVHKVPITILSRCQRYDFKLIGAQTVSARLRYVLDQEGLAADDAALALLGRQAAGSMRDAMSLLDQVIAWSGADRITVEVVSRVLGVAGRASLQALAERVLAGDAAGALSVVAQVAEQGFDLTVFGRDFLGHLRDLVVAKVSEDRAVLADLADAELADLRALAGRTELDDLVRVHQGFSRGFDEIARSGQVRAALEMALVRLSRRPALLPLGELFDRLARLEARLGGGAAGGGTAGGGVGGGGSRPLPPDPRRDAPTARPPQRMEGPRADALPPRPSASESRPSPAGSRQAEPASIEPPAPAAPPSLAAPAAPAAPPADPPPRRPALAVAATFTAPAAVAAPPQGGRGAPTAARDVAPHATPVEGVPRLRPPRRESRPAPAPAQVDRFRAAVAHVAAERPDIGNLLPMVLLDELGAERVVLSLPSPFLVTKLDAPGVREVVLRGLAAAFGGTPSLEMVEGDRPDGVSLSRLDQAARRAAVDAARQKVMEHPLVVEAVRALGAEVRDVKLPA